MLYKSVWHVTMRAMDLTENKAVARRWIQAFDDEDVEALAALVTPDFTYHQMVTPLRGPAELVAMARRVYAAWQPHRFEIHDEIAEGDRVVLRMTAHDTHVGIYQGIHGTGAQIVWDVVFIFQIRDGKVAEIWRTADDMARIRGVGAKVVKAE